jgi:energy-coupling factor transporter transmembrane protein EcfT
MLVGEEKNYHVLNGHVSIFLCIFLLYLTEIETLLVTLLFFMLGVTE